MSVLGTNPYEQSDSRKFYIIWRNGKGAGFFSIIASILGHIKIAETQNLQPVVDFKTYKNVYSEKEQVNGSENAFEYYFNPIHEESLDEIYASGSYELSGGEYPENHTMSVSTDPSLLQIWNKYFVINNEVEKRLNNLRGKLEIDNRTLGIHFRGQEMRRARSHPLPMSIKQAVSLTQKMLTEGAFDKVFVVTEGRNYLRHFKKAFPGKVVASESFRSFIWNSYRFKVRKLHHYKLGLEILTDTILLSECGGLISGSSNVSEMAILLNDGAYLRNIQVRNGKNKENRFSAKFYWYFKYLQPERLGGLPKTS